MTVDERQLVTMLSDPSTQRKAFEQVVRQYSEQLYWQVRRIVLSHEDANDARTLSYQHGFIALPLTKALISCAAKKWQIWSVQTILWE